MVEDKDIAGLAAFITESWSSSSEIDSYTNDMDNIINVFLQLLERIVTHGTCPHNEQYFEMGATGCDECMQPDRTLQTMGLGPRTGL